MWLFLPLVGLQFLFLPQAYGQSQVGFEEVAQQAARSREQNDIPRAIGLYSQGVQLKPEWSEGWWFLGSLQYGTGDYTAARDALNHFVTLNPNAAPALALRGLCEFEIADYAQSLADIQHALSLGAANQERNERILRFHEAMLLTRTGRFEDALRAYDFFSRAEGSDPELLVAVGLAGLRTQLLPSELSAEKQPLFTAAGQATLAFMAGRTDAQPAFEDLFRRFPSASNTHYLHAYLLFPTDPEAALEEFRRETEVTPNNAAAAMMVSWILLVKEKPADALPYAKRSVELQASSSTAQLVLGRSLLETGDTREGMDHLQKALQIEPNNLEAHLAMVKAYSRSGRKDDAKRERQQCLQLVASETTQVAHP